jgi:hypothetical protein
LSDQLLSDVCRALLAERDALRKEVDNLCKYADRYRAMASAASDQLAAARGEVNGLRSALQQIFARSSQARPAYYEATILKIEGISEDALKSSQSNVQKMHIAAHAPREVTVQEAARVLLDEYLEHGEGLLGELACYDIDWDETGAEMVADADGDWVSFTGVETALRTLANEGQSDE